MPFIRYGRPGLLSTVAPSTVIAGTAAITANVIDRRAGERAVQEQGLAANQSQREAAEEAHAAVRSAEADAAAAESEAEKYATIAPAPIGEDLVGQLRELARLRDSGALSQEEFARAKSRLLSN